MNNGTIGFSDVFKSSFFSRAVESFALIDVLLALIFAVMLGYFIYLIYKRSYQGVMYSRSFNLSLMTLPVVTCLVLLAVTSNIVLSLGMVGALSIVRFRTAIKEPMDIVFLFWAIGVGIVAGAGMFLIALTGSLIVGAVIMVMSVRNDDSSPYLLVTRLSAADAERAIYHILTDNVKKYSVKSKSVLPGNYTELTVEVLIKGDNTDFINEISATGNVESAVLVSYNGDYSI